MKKRMLAAKSRIPQLRNSLGTAKLSMLDKLWMMKTFVLPVYEYGSHLVRLEDSLSRTSEDIVDEGLRWVTGANTGKLLRRAKAAAQLFGARARRERAAKILLERLCK